MFKITIKGDIKETMSKVEKEIKNNGGSFTNRNISVKGVKLEYRVDWQEVTIWIIDKPWLVSDSYIEDKIREYF